MGSHKIAIPPPADPFLTCTSMAQVLQVYTTPNPNAQKFVTDTLLQPLVGVSIDGPHQSHLHGIAPALFSVKGVESLWLFEATVVVFAQQRSWVELVPEVAFVLEDQIQDYPPIDQTNVETVSHSVLSTPILPDNFWAMPTEQQRQHAEAILNWGARPMLQQDGGDVELADIEGQTIFVRYKGACGSCPTSTGATLEQLNYLFKTHAHPLATVQSIPDPRSSP